MISFLARAYTTEQVLRSGLRGLLVAAVVSCVGVPNAASRCLDDPTHEGFVAIVRDGIADHCACRGEPAAYLRCARDVIDRGIKDGMLPQECRSTIEDSVNRSVCGKPGYVPCCVRGGPDGASICTVQERAKCSGTPGRGTSCYDACSSLPNCGTPEFVAKFGDDRLMDQKKEAAIAKWTAAGRLADFTDGVFPRWLFSQLTIEMGCWESPGDPGVETDRSAQPEPSPPRLRERDQPSRR